MKITEEGSGQFRIEGVRDGVEGAERDFSASLEGEFGPGLKCLQTGAEIAFDLFNGQLQALVNDGSTDEPAVMVKFDDIGEVVSIKVRADLRSKVKTL